jgi:cbb3-type cytochrome oxidase maturation protein
MLVNCQLSFAEKNCVDTFDHPLAKSQMSAIFILIGASLLVACGFLIAFIRAVRNGQFDDDYTPSVRMLFDDELKSEKNPEAPGRKTSTNV